MRAVAAAARNPAATVGGAILVTLFAVALLFPLTGYDVVSDVSVQRDLGPGAAHLLGTDHAGRDVLARAMLATDAFVGPGLLACLVALAFGVPSGAAAGYLGGPAEGAIRYVFTVLNSLPRFVLVLLVCSIYGSSPTTLALVAGVAYAPALGEAVFGRIEELRGADYVVANRAHGLPEWRILWVHLVWAACRRLILRSLLTLFGYFVVLEATLSYLGQYGVTPPDPSWGNMIRYLDRWDHPSLVVRLTPVVLLAVVVLATTWVREAIHEVDHG